VPAGLRPLAPVNLGVRPHKKMHALLLALHLVFVGLWLGCVVTEALFERALLGQGRDKELILTALHKRVDLFIEIPAFTLVIVTGAFLLAGVQENALFHLKLGFAFVAIVTNIYCVHLVFKRDRLARSSDWAAFEAIDHLQHKMGAIVLIGILGALGLGIYLFSGAFGV
jgi:putative copper export protein